MAKNIGSTQLRKGTAFKDNDRAYVVQDYKHIKKGRGLAIVRVKIRDINSGSIVEKTFTSKEKVEGVELIRKSAQYLYKDSENYYFMDSQSFSQFEVNKEMLKGKRNYLTEGMKVDTVWLDEKIVDIGIPKKVAMVVKKTEPAVAGDSATNPTKEAILETGYKVQVPLFIKSGDQILMNTEKGIYVSKK